MTNIFQFGEGVPGYDYRVINERDARASAGIMFLFGIISFFSFIMTHNLFWAEVFTLTFILEFAIRVFVNPLYAPYMVLGSLFVSNQHPDWVEAAPKKFAWILGIGLGLVMAYFIVFGICLGCLIYKRFNVDLQNCPGGVCETPPAKRGSMLQKVTVLALFAFLSVGMYQTLKVYKYHNFQPQLSQTDKEDLEMMIEGVADEAPAKPKLAVATKTKLSGAEGEKDCTPPQWAIEMGHETLWKEHNGCK